MSAEILKAKKQLGDVYMLLKQGKLMAAASNLYDAVSFVLRAQLMKHELQTFVEALDKAAYLLSNDRELKKIYPLKISYKPGEEKELQDSLHALLGFLQDNLNEEINAQLAAQEDRRQKQLTQARELLQQGEMDKARQVCQRLVASAAYDADLKATVADLFLEVNAYEDALEYLKAAYTDDPESAPIFNKLGIVLRKSGHLEEAEKFYIQALERQTKDEYIYFNLGRVYIDMKSWKNAIACADRALRINSDFVEAKKMKLFATKQMEQ
ncbi:tetratricopeptide repeat protein [Desulfovibrionales bacterium]